MLNQEFTRMARRAPKGRNVKSERDRAAADLHERAKDFLTPTEIDILLEALKCGRHGARDYLLGLMMYRHGLRVSEAISLRRDEVDLNHARLWVRRLKNGLSVEQPIAGDEMRAIKRYLGTRNDALPWLFLSERNQPMTRQAVKSALGLRSDARRSTSRAAAHATAFVWLLSRQSRLRPAPDPGLSRPPRSEAHGSLHANSGERFEGLWR